MDSYKVYFENRYITISPEPDRMQKYTLFHRYHNAVELYRAISSFKAGSDFTMNIYGYDINHLWEEFRGYFTFVEAAGGLVRHPSGNYLFIVRNGRWDLPKGHMEEGEEPEACAIREVMEECGLTGHRIIRALHPSFHTWEYEGVSYLKQTHWFLMRYDGEMVGHPQEEEGITEVRWMKPDKICIIRESAWHSLTELINSSILGV
ncbi:MAG: NUDIX domain-containing protein [Bacteroidales bacterium]|jgi:8-oxo-dGTP pyrophosphatase MutT (NUDIX family)|nr:NUDIX domain-containing protein [Bacteroidales bacterium]